VVRRRSEEKNTPNPVLLFSTEKLLALALLHTGRWLAQTRSESTQIIREDFLMESIRKLRDLGEMPDKAFFILGNFLSGVYSNLVAHQKVGAVLFLLRYVHA
jgi:hypothetical protein